MSTTLNTGADLTVGSRISVRRHNGALIKGTVTSIGRWHNSCAGTPMRWIGFTSESGGVHTIADTRFDDGQITVYPLNTSPERTTP